MEISAQLQKSLIKDMYTVGIEAYDAMEEQWPKYYKEIPLPDNSGDFWQDTSVVLNGTWRKTAGTEGFSHRAITEGYTVWGRIFDFTDAFCISNNTVSDLSHFENILKKVSAAWGETAKQTREEFYARDFVYGGVTTGDWSFNGTPSSGAVTDTSGDGAYDGTTASPIPLFNLSTNTRTSIGGGSYYNGFALPLTPDNIKSVWTHITSVNNFYENDSSKFNNTPNVMVLPTNLGIDIEEITTSTLEAWKSTNTNNVLGNKFEVIQNSFITDTDLWALGIKGKSFNALNRMEPVFDMFPDKLNRCKWLTAEMRIGKYFNNFRHWACSNMSTG